MATEEAPTTDAHGTFEYLSNEYAQAVHAFKAIEEQAATIAAFGGSEDLRNYIGQFIEMASRVRATAIEKKESHFVEWFDELIGKAEALRTELVSR